MAVDTRDRRMSMITLASPVPAVLPDPDGTLDTQDRAMLLWLYHGFDYEVVVPGFAEDDAAVFLAFGSIRVFHRFENIRVYQRFEDNRVVAEED